MSAELQAIPEARCVDHPRRETALRCGKCDSFICSQCMVPTPVGVRCRRCANLRRLPQFDVGPLLLARSSAGGLIASLATWYLVSYAPFLRYFLAILVGVAVGATMSSFARRRSNKSLEIAAVVAVLVGLAAVEFSRHGLLIPTVLRGGAGPMYLASLAIPALVASVVAVIKLR